MHHLRARHKGWRMEDRQQEDKEGRVGVTGRSGRGSDRRGGEESKGSGKGVKQRRRGTGRKEGRQERGELNGGGRRGSGTGRQGLRGRG